MLGIGRKKLVIPQKAFVRRNRLVREGLRTMLTAIPWHRQGAERDILLLSSRRSGSTWLMEMLGAASGVRTVDEPFGPKFIGRSYLAHFPELHAIYKGHRVFDFPPSLVPHVDEYMRDPRLTKLSGPYNPLAPSYHWMTSRRLWKVIHANPAIEYFLKRAEHYHTFALLRHPCPTILSMSRKYPGPELALILEQKDFCERHLTSAQYDSFMDIERKGSIIEKYAAEWTLEQLVPWKLFPDYRDVCEILSFEELKNKLWEGIEFLVRYCGLGNNERKIFQAAELPSASTADDRLQTVKQASGVDGLNAWRLNLDSDLERRIFDIIAIVGIDYYEPKRDLPRDPYLKGF